MLFHTIFYIWDTCRSRCSWKDEFLWLSVLHSNINLPKLEYNILPVQLSNVRGSFTTSTMRTSEKNPAVSGQRPIVLTSQFAQWPICCLWEGHKPKLWPCLIFSFTPKHLLPNGFLQTIAVEDSYMGKRKLLPWLSFLFSQQFQNSMEKSTKLDFDGIWAFWPHSCHQNHVFGNIFYYLDGREVDMSKPHLKRTGCKHEENIISCLCKDMSNEMKFQNGRAEYFSSLNFLINQRHLYSVKKAWFVI